MESVSSLAIHTIGSILNPKYSSNINGLVYLSKLSAGGGMFKTEILLGWKLDTRRIIISLPDDQIPYWN